MKFAVNLSGLGARHYADVAEAAEANGFAAIWTPEHLIFPVVMPPNYSYTADGLPPMRPDTPTFDPFVVLASVASRTKTIKLGTNVFILPLRNPISVARSVITLDRISGGRVLFGVGVGWLPDEFEIVGEDFRNRGKRTDEMIELMRKLWSEDTIEYHGKYYDIPPVKFAPKPVDKKNGIPFIVGGTTAPALRRAGRIGDGWTHHRTYNVSLYKGEATPPVSEDEFVALADHIATINRHREEAGRADLPFEWNIGMGTSPAVIERVAEMGATLYSVSFGAKNLLGTKDDFIDWIKKFADEVIAKF